MKMLRAGDLRHQVTVKRPREGNLDAGGATQGDDLTVYDGWPCSIETVSGGESEVGGQNVATATYLVAGYTDPARPIKERDYLVMHNGRVLNVGSVEDVDQLGIVARLVCGESK